MRLKKTNEIVKIDKNVNCKTTNFFLNKTFFFINNFNLKILTIASKIVRRFCKIDIAIKIKKNHYNEKLTEKKRFFKKKLLNKRSNQLIST